MLRIGATTATQCLFHRQRLARLETIVDNVVVTADRMDGTLKVIVSIVRDCLSARTQTCLNAYTRGTAEINPYSFACRTCHVTSTVVAHQRPALEYTIGLLPRSLSNTQDLDHRQLGQRDVKLFALEEVPLKAMFVALVTVLIFSMILSQAERAFDSHYKTSEQRWRTQIVVRSCRGEPDPRTLVAHMRPASPEGLRCCWHVGADPYSTELGISLRLRADKGEVEWLTGGRSRRTGSQ